jgi:membrane protein YdbS with pleckstrin-like domain
MRDHFEGVKIVWKVYGVVQALVLLYVLVYGIVELFRHGYANYVYLAIGVISLLVCLFSRTMRSGLITVLRRIKGVLRPDETPRSRVGRPN